MTDINQLHNASMAKAEMALLARMREADDESQILFRESLDLELDAIMAMGETAVEPTYSILHRSAATLALDCNDPRLAEKLIGRALAHDPPAELAEELRDLLEQVYFRRHLQVKGVALAEDELQMSLAGRAVGLGVIEIDEFLSRVDRALKLIYRTVERRLAMPFRERGRPKKSIKADYGVFLSAARPGSYAVTLKLGGPSAQLKLLNVVDASDIVDEVMESMSLLSKGDFDGLTKRIPDRAYRRNFVELGRRIAPDGENVRMVGLTSMHRGRRRSVELTKAKAEMLPPEKPDVSGGTPAERVTVRGVLRFADARQPDRREIMVIDEEARTTYRVKVPKGMMSDIVRPLWESSVVVTGTRAGEYILLEDIQEQ